MDKSSLTRIKSRRSVVAFVDCLSTTDLDTFASLYNAGYSYEQIWKYLELPDYLGQTPYHYNTWGWTVRQKLSLPSYAKRSFTSWIPTKSLLVPVTPIKWINLRKLQRMGGYHTHVNLSGMSVTEKNCVICGWLVEVGRGPRPYVHTDEQDGDVLQRISVSPGTPFPIVAIQGDSTVIG